MGKFYEIFFADAIICQKILDLNWMGGIKKLHVGFPEKALDKYLQILVGLGHKVAVIEQVETPRQLEERLKIAKKSGSVKKEDKCIARDIIQMVTRGTFQGSSMFGEGSMSTEPKYILAYKKLGSHFGVTFLDTHTLKIFIGHFKEQDETLL